MGELLAGLGEAFVALLELVAEILVVSATMAYSCIRYAVSAKHREKKRAEWKANPRSKYLEFGVLGTWVIGLTLLIGWLNMPPKDTGNGHLHIKKAEQGEDTRFMIQFTNRAGMTNEATFAIKEGGIKKMLETKTIQELGKEVGENIVKVPPKKAKDGPAKD